MSQHGANHTTLRKIIDKWSLDLTKINENRKLIQTRGLKRVNKAIPLEDILTGKYNKPYKGSNFKDRLIKEGYKEYRCERCGLTEWLGKPIPLQIHHIDGVHNNNLLENLELLCPNCHVLTDNFGGKNVKHPKILKKEDAKRVAKKGISEDGQRLYDGYGNYKILCPICKTNFMTRGAEKCKECYTIDHITPKIPKDELYQAINETNNYAEIARRYHYHEDTIAKWHRYYAKQDKENGIITIASENAPDRETLKKELRELSFNEIGRIHGDVNGNTVKKWCISYSLPYLRSEIEKINEDDWMAI